MCQLASVSKILLTVMMMLLSCFLEQTSGSCLGMHFLLYYMYTYIFCAYIDRVYFPWTDRNAQPDLVYLQVVSENETTYHCHYENKLCDKPGYDPIIWCINQTPLQLQHQNAWSKYYDIMDCTFTAAENTSSLTLKWNFSVLIESSETDAAPTVYCAACECTEYPIPACSENHHSHYFVVTAGTYTLYACFSCN